MNKQELKAYKELKARLSKEELAEIVALREGMVAVNNKVEAAKTIDELLARSLELIEQREQNRYKVQ